MSSQVVLSGSKRQHPRNSVPAGTPDADEIVQITLVVRRKQPVCDALLKRMGHEELTEVHGADLADIEMIERFAAKHGLSIKSVNHSSRCVSVGGPLAKMPLCSGRMWN